MDKDLILFIIGFFIGVVFMIIVSSVIFDGGLQNHANQLIEECELPLKRTENCELSAKIKE